jgi:hypothetical protein
MYDSKTLKPASQIWNITIEEKKVCYAIRLAHFKNTSAVLALAEQHHYYAYVFHWSFCSTKHCFTNPKYSHRLTFKTKGETDLRCYHVLFQKTNA